jgi:hypothetical protein
LLRLRAGEVVRSTDLYGLFNTPPVRERVETPSVLSGSLAEVGLEVGLEVDLEVGLEVGLEEGFGGCFFFFEAMASTAF